MANNKSRSYPKLTLSAAIDVVSEASKLGKIISKETLAGIGRKDVKGSTKSGAFMRKISALDQYGLIIVSKEGIRFTDIAKEIVFPTDEIKKIESIVQAFLTPTTFFELYNSLSKNIPIGVHLIKNKAQRDLGITSAGVNSFINGFIESGELAGLIKYTSEDRTAIQIIEIVNEREENQQNKGETDNNESKSAMNNNSILKTQSATLIFNEGKATIEIEGNMTDVDVKRLKAQIDVFALREEPYNKHDREE
jgi:hypothetical protein